MLILIAESSSLYVGLALVMAVLGRRRKLGAWGYFFASILLTPIIGFLLVLASDPRPREPKLNAAAVAAIEQRVYRRSGGVLGPPSVRR